MSQCNYTRLPDKRWMCARCLRVSKSTRDKAPKGSCSVRGLGDYLKSILEAFGLTRARWLAFKSSLGLKRCCLCSQRQEKVNRWGDWLRGALRRLKV